MGGLFDRLQDEINDREHKAGLSPVDLLDLPPELAAVIRKIVRKNGLRLADLATELNQTSAAVQKNLDELVEKGYVRRVEVKDEIWYKARFRRRTDKPLSSTVWNALDKAIDEDE